MSFEHCSFCGTPRKLVKKLVSAPGVFICDVCIRDCVEILDGELSAESIARRALVEGLAEAERLRRVNGDVINAVGIMVAEGDDLPTAVRREVKRLKGTHWKDEQGQWVLSDEQAIRADAAREERERAFRDGYQAGFYATGEGHNGEYVSPNCTQAELDEDREIAVAKYTAAAPIVTDADPAQEALAKRIDAKLREGGEP